MAKEITDAWRGISDDEAMARRYTGTSFVAVGVGLVLAGVLSLIASFFATMAWVVVIGFAMLFAGIVTVVEAIAGRGLRDALPSVLLGGLYGVMGLLFIVRPGVGSAALTLLITAMFFISGLVRVVSALMLRYPRWALGVASGVVSALLGLILFGMWPQTATWLIGTLVGIELIFAGFTSIGIARAVRPRTKYQPPAPRRESPRPPSGPSVQPPVH